MTAGLVLDAPAARGQREGPHVPTIIRAAWQKPLAFPSMAALARHIHRERRGRGVQLTRCVAAFHLSDTFPAFRVAWLTDDDAEYAFTIAVQGRSREALEAAIADANPDVPE